jgi:hypothetical protein
LPSIDRRRGPEHHGYAFDITQGGLVDRIRTDSPVYLVLVMDAHETMNVSLGRTLLVVAASDGPPWTATS